MFERDGWVWSRCVGDHDVSTKPGARRPLVIPLYGDAPVFIIRNLLRTAGMTGERFFALLEDT